MKSLKYTYDYYNVLLNSFSKRYVILNHSKESLHTNTAAIYATLQESYEVGHTSISSDHELFTGYLKQTFHTAQWTSVG